MQIIVTATNITIGEVTYPFNSLYFKSDNTTISIYQVGMSSPVIVDVATNFTNASGGNIGDAATVLALLKTSLVAP